MIFLTFAALMYFLPSIIGHNKRDATGIFLLNFFLGWTIIGWVAALFWACTSDACPPVVVVGGPGRFCSQCGAMSAVGARFCAACGRPV